MGVLTDDLLRALSTIVSDDPNQLRVLVYCLITI